jgi:ATP-dependent Clp protease ATP-binding subunit ClpA
MAPSRTRFGLGQVYRDAATQAALRGDRTVSTDHILLALLADPSSVTARALGVSLARAHATLDGMDHQALASLSIDVDVAATPLHAEPGRGRMRLTPAGRRLFTSLGQHANGKRLGIHHVLVALLAQRAPDPAAEVLDALHVNRDAVRQRLRELT